MGLWARDVWLVGVLLFVSSAPALAGPAQIDAAELALQSGNPANAVALANEVLSDSSVTSPDRARILADRGLAHEMLGEHESALADFTAAIAAHGLADAEQARAY